MFYGATSDSESAEDLYALDVASSRTRRLAPDTRIGPPGEGFPLAPTPDGRAVLLDVPTGDLHRIVAVPRFGNGSVETVLTLTRASWYMDVGKDGTLYTDELDRPHEVLRFPVAGGRPEVIAHSDSSVVTEYMDPLETTDGRFLEDTRVSGRGQLLVGKPGGDFSPLLDTKEETSPPATSLPGDEVAFVLGSGDEKTIAIASAGQGRVIRRLQGTKGRSIDMLAASPDGNTLCYVSEGNVWTIPVNDGTPRQITKGNSVAVNPNGRDLVIKLDQNSGGHLVRVPASGGTSQEIPLPRDLWMAPVPLGQRAIAKDGRLLITVSPRDSWFYRAVSLDPATTTATTIPLNYTGDTMRQNWTSDGQILAIGLPLRSHVWRFRHPEERRQ